MAATASVMTGCGAGIVGSLDRAGTKVPRASRLRRQQHHIATSAVVVATSRPEREHIQGEPTMQFPRRPPARWVLAFTVGVVLAATAGCTSDHPEKAAQRQDTASVPFADPIDSQTPGAGPHLTGFGATRHEWNNNHTEIPGSSPGSTYDRDPNIITDSGRPGIRYVTVSTEGGRVTKYQFNFPSHTDTDSALAKLR